MFTDHTRLAARVSVLAVVVAAALLAVALPDSSHAGPSPLIVNDAGDTPDANPGDDACATAGAVCTLRAAIEEANSDPQLDEIHFAIPLQRADVSAAGVVYTIQPSSVLPAISQPVILDGRTQNGYDGTPLVHLDGSFVPEGQGLFLSGADSTIAGLRISGFPDNPGTTDVFGAQIITFGATSPVIEDNVLGLNSAGLSSGSEIGLWVFQSPSALVRGNVASGNNRYGMLVQDTTNANIAGNIVGLDESGDAAAPNDIYGVFIFGASNVTIGAGGGSAGLSPSGNLISGNGVNGILVDAAPNTTIDGNYIGTDIAGNEDLGNDNYGVLIRESANSAIIGNVISGNGSEPFDAGIGIFDLAPLVDVGDAGVTPGGSLTIRDNLVGTNAACDAAISNENGIVALDQPNDNRLFWDSVLIDGNTISGNEGTASAAAAGTVTASGSDMVSGDGLVWGALLPPGEGGLVISNGSIGSDCSGDPLGNAGDGMILGLQPAHNGVAVPAGLAVLEFFFAGLGVGVSNNGEDCIQADIFDVFGPPGRVGQTGDLGDILGLTAEWQNITANDCGENGIEINQAMSVLSYTEDSRVILDEVEANTNGENGLAINQTLVSGGGLPRTDVVLTQTNDNGASGIVIGATAAASIDQPVQRKTTIAGSQADGNGGDGVRVRDLVGGGVSQFDGSSPPVTIEDSSITDNGGAGASVGSYLPRPVFTPVGSPDPPQPLAEVRFSILSDNDGPGLEVLQLPAPIRAGGSSRVGGAGTITSNTIIYNNGEPAIDLGGDGPTANDAMDADAGPNGLTNFPVLTSAASGNSITIAGTYDGVPSTNIELRFYSNTACEEGGEGEFDIGFRLITTDAQGHSDFDVKFDQKNTPGRFVAATATSPEGVSEFSACIEGEGLGGLSGDTDCDKDVDSVDGLNVLRDVAGFPASKCIEAGNVDCDSDRDSIDALFILRDVAALPVNLPKGCPEIGG